MKSIRTTILTSKAIFVNFLLFILEIFFKNQNDVEFDLSIGHALVVFPFLSIINKKCKVNHVTNPPPRNPNYILI